MGLDQAAAELGRAVLRLHYGWVGQGQARMLGSTCRPESPITTGVTVSGDSPALVASRSSPSAAFFIFENTSEQADGGRHRRRPTTSDDRGGGHRKTAGKMDRQVAVESAGQARRDAPICGLRGKRKDARSVSPEWAA